ncbi:hypothetical protein PA598K_03417 [Paenibacillus sp. 598K]|uniref:NAD-dependent epimerase/dehydratase family protein n=1 Tax=Paenibacillus sp. 598K TaxID=1117987 RepID=UPI000FFA4959|nr:SDR family oxidoreductase [Paenibacillus sp. 598K]GBF75038.1 hypothetical protein PA598K_03417 [Paenibacillus sp. 598K]
MKHVLLVGGAGYVGSVLVRHLLQAGYRTTLVDTFDYGRGTLAAYEGLLGIIEADMRSIGREMLETVDAVINLGGFSNDPTANYNPAKNWALNRVAAAELARNSKSAGVPLYILASSCSIYDRQRLAGDADALLTEDSHVEPLGPYSVSKYEAEQAILPLRDEHFMPVILRKGTVYGYSPRMRFDLVVNTMVKDALTKNQITLHLGGEMWRPMIEVNDVARAYLQAIEASYDPHDSGIYNILSQNVRISEVGLRVLHTLRELGHECDLRMDYAMSGIRNYRVDNAKAKARFGLQSEHSIESAVADIYRRYREQAWMLEDDIYYNMKWMKSREEQAIR